MGYARPRFRMSGLKAMGSLPRCLIVWVTRAALMVAIVAIASPASARSYDAGMCDENSQSIVAPPVAPLANGGEIRAVLDIGCDFSSRMSATHGTSNPFEASALTLEISERTLAMTAAWPAIPKSNPTRVGPRSSDPHRPGVLRSVYRPPR